MAKDNTFTHFIETLKTKCDIVSTVSRYLPLQKKGKNYWACCPFHGEKTPSFSVNPDGFYKCFGCGETGDVIRFVEAYENLDFMEAVNSLAKTAGLEVPKFKKEEGAASDAKQKKEKYAQICRLTAKFYYSVLKGQSGQAKKTTEYLEKRGIDSATVTRFGLGLSPDFSSLPDFLSAKGFSMQECAEAGVLGLSENGTYYDALSERLIFPIINVYGLVVGFGGRVLKKSNFAKYKNTMQTLLFDKSKNLYAVHNLKKAKRAVRIEQLIVVEGYMDAISLIKAGFEFTVASMGTSLTVEQARLMQRFADTVVICYDGDSAGQAATLRGLEILKAQGINVRIASLPDGLDPDDVIRKQGAEAYQKCLDAALPLTDYRLKIILDKHDIEGERAEEAKRNYLNEALPILRELEGTEKESYIKILSRQTGFAPDFLKKECEKKADTKRDVLLEKNVIIKGTRKEYAVKYILAAMLFSKYYAEEFDLAPYIVRAGHADILQYINDCRSEGKKPLPSMVFDITEHRKDAEELLEIDFGEDEIGERVFLDSKKILIDEQVKNQIAKLKQSFKTETDMQKKKEIAAQIQMIEQKRRRNT